VLREVALSTASCIALIVIIVVTGTFPAWYPIALGVLLAVGIVRQLVFRTRLVVRLTTDGLFAGRTDGRRMDFGAVRPFVLRWDEITDVREARTAFRTRRVQLPTTTYLRHLPIPRSFVLNPDPDYDAGLELIRRTWLERRGPIAPDPVTPPQTPAT
jgi:hypothetical protein